MLQYERGMPRKSAQARITSRFPTGTNCYVDYPSCESLYTVFLTWVYFGQIGNEVKGHDDKCSMLFKKSDNLIEKFQPTTGKSET